MLAWLRGFRFHMMDIVWIPGMSLYYSWKFGIFWPLGAAFLVIAWYAVSIWTKRGRRLALPFSSPKCPSWRPLQYPHRALYHCPPESHSVRAHYEETADDADVQDAVAWVFRSKGSDEVDVREQVETWRRMVRDCHKHLVFRRLPRMAGGWAQIHHRSAARTEQEMNDYPQEAICVVGLESYMLGAAELRSTCTHEMVHVAQQLHRNLLYREWHGEVPFSKAVHAEWQALKLAGQLPWVGWVIFRTPLLVLAVVLFCVMAP